MRIGSAVYTVAQLKIMQEVITLSVFCVFAMVFLGEKIRWNYVAAFAGFDGGGGIRVLAKAVIMANGLGMPERLLF